MFLVFDFWAFQNKILVFLPNSHLQTNFNLLFSFGHKLHKIDIFCPIYLNFVGKTHHIFTFFAQKYIFYNLLSCFFYYIGHKHHKTIIFCPKYDCLKPSTIIYLLFCLKHMKFMCKKTTIITTNEPTNPTFKQTFIHSFIQSFNQINK